ncbi:MAG TPA: tripartite tricarboxylate transporter substrate-binding protein [Stellaceae bacterium]|nr:tripartite tricarboxylate transporter substrate-binding protein [Stellaceae bacterium]
MFRLAILALCLVLWVFPAKADAIADFYRGKDVTLVVATPPGGPYDICARLLARHLGLHIPGDPSIVVENMGGAAGMLAANYLYNRAPQDGTVLGNLHNALVLAKATGRLKVDVDPAKFNWIGNMTRETGDVIVSAKSPVKTIADAKTHPVIMGAESPLALGGIYPQVMNAVLGTKFKVVMGYDGHAGIEHALDSGEVEGMAGDSWLHGQGRQYEWYKAGTIRILVQIGSRADDLPNVPLLTDLAANDSDREILELFSSPYAIGKPTAVGPGVPADRVAALRAAYMETMADPAFVADAKQLGILIAPVSGPELGDLVKRLSTLPDALLVRAKAITAQ